MQYIYWNVFLTRMCQIGHTGQQELSSVESRLYLHGNQLVYSQLHFINQYYFLHYSFLPICPGLWHYKVIPPIHSKAFRVLLASLLVTTCIFVILFTIVETHTIWRRSQQVRHDAGKSGLLSFYHKYF